MTPAALYILYAILAVGAGGVGLMLPASPTRPRSIGRAGAIMGVAALAMLIVSWTRWIGPDMQGRAFFVIFAAVAVTAAIRVVTHAKPVYSALYFVLVVLSVTGLCILASATFLGATLVIVYGGAILVVYLFVIMLAQQGGMAPYDTMAREPLAAVTLAFLIAAAATHAIASADTIAAAEPVVIPDEADNVRAMGESLMTTYVIGVEIAGVLLLVAMIGAIAIARKRIEPDDLTPEERAAIRAGQEDPRRRGREAPPF